MALRTHHRSWTKKSSGFLKQLLQYQDKNIILKVMSIFYATTQIEGSARKHYPKMTHRKQGYSKY